MPEAGAMRKRRSGSRKACPASVARCAASASNQSARRSTSHATRQGAIWIHAMGALPWIALLGAASLRTVERRLEEESLLDASPLTVLTRVSLSRGAGGFWAGALWVAIICATEIAVTDLFQIRTFAEEIYTEATMGPLGALPGGLLRTDLAVGVAIIAAAVGLALLLTLPWLPVAASIHVLIVDDQMSIRSLVRSGLNQLGVQHIGEASDGAEALRSLALNPVHLVISDYNMPNMDGLALLKTMRAQPATAKTAFIMLTGRADRELVQKAVQLGVNNYLVKPFNVAVLKGKIEQVFGVLT